MPQDRTKLGLSDDINNAYNIDNIKDIELNNNKIILTNKSNVKTTI
jgi:hypothetical protein